MGRPGACAYPQPARQSPGDIKVDHTTPDRYHAASSVHALALPTAQSHDFQALRKLSYMDILSANGLRQFLVTGTRRMLETPTGEARLRLMKLNLTNG